MLYLNESSITLGIMHETFFGKTPELMAIEAQLDKFRQKYIALKRYVLIPEINTDEDLLKFNRMIEDYFGFGTFSLTIINKPIANAFTMPIGYRVDVNRSGKDIIVDKKGYKFKKEYNYIAVVYIFSGLILNPDFTTEECMATIMHEIGHNFFQCLSKSNGVLSTIALSFNIVSTIILIISNSGAIVDLGFSNTLMNLQHKIDKKLGEKFKLLAGLIVIYQDMRSYGESIALKVFKTMNYLTLGFLGAALEFNNLKNSSISPMLIETYRNERAADNFATMYGYGPATASLQSKFESKDVDVDSMSKAINKNLPYLAALTNLNMLPGEILLSAMDPHPSGYNRAKDQINLLKHELDKADLDPKMKKEIKLQIAQCEKTMNEFTNVTSADKDPYVSRKIYNKYITSKIPGLKQVILDDKDKFDEYDKQYEKLSH